MARFIVISGGVVSSLGKGVCSASMAALLQAHGYSVRVRKLDPYLNVDAGTMNPFEHGEVFVTDDGAETDLDLGHYERFTNTDATIDDNITSGRIFREVFEKERRGAYRGRTVQVIPHVTDEIINFISKGSEDYDFVICEIGGTVGDIEGLPFLEAIRQMTNSLPREQRLFVHLTLIPYIGSASELKTKPTQHSVKELRSIGITPDVLLARCEHDIDRTVRGKISLHCNVPTDGVIGIPTVDSIYSLPLLMRERGLDNAILTHFGLDQKERKDPDLSVWETIKDKLATPINGEVRIAVVGKYTDHGDAYFSLDEALTHGGIAHGIRVLRDYLPSEKFDQGDIGEQLNQYHALVVPGGFGARGIEGMINVVAYARERKLPFLGICYGLQMAVIEAARNLAGIAEAGTSEEGDPDIPVISRLSSWTAGGRRVERTSHDQVGGTMRLGAYSAVLAENSRIAKIYGTNLISERHRHRFEVDRAHIQSFAQKAGIRFSGWSPDGEVPEILERDDHPWFFGVQFHPELKSRPMAPHPLFASLIKAAHTQSLLV